MESASVSSNRVASINTVMRKFINIVESGGFTVPDFKQYITPHFIEELIQAGTWSSHGSDLFSWWDEGALDYFNGEDEGLAGLNWDQAMEQDREACARILHNFLVARADWIRRNFVSGEFGIEPFGPECALQRAIMVNDAWVESISQPRRGPLPLGVYWGLNNVEPWGANSHEAQAAGRNHMVEVVTKAKYVSIDWFETFRSRIDWLNGDEEQEIQLHKGSPIEHVERIFYACSDTRPELARAHTAIPIHPSATFIA